jgi:hypothetical protein
MATDYATRVVVIGNSGSGKSTVATRILCNRSGHLVLLRLPQTYRVPKTAPTALWGRYPPTSPLPDTWVTAMGSSGRSGRVRLLSSAT